ncbi:MAG: type II toxin-antitoxin system HigB family toxin [Bacteroidia bacterium]
MNIIKTKTLYDKVKLSKYKMAENQVQAWMNDFEKSDYTTPNEVKKKYSSADFVGNNTVIFNIKGNDYRLIVRIRYKFSRIYIIWFGTHKEYDKLKDIENLKFEP